MNWDIDYDPEVPEKFPNFRRDDDENEGGSWSLPWHNSMALSRHEGLDGPLQARQFVQTYGMTIGGGAGLSRAQKGGASRAVSINIGKPNKEKGEGMSKGGGEGEKGSHGGCSSREGIS